MDHTPRNLRRASAGKASRHPLTILVWRKIEKREQRPLRSRGVCRLRLRDRQHIAVPGCRVARHRREGTIRRSQINADAK